MKAASIKPVLFRLHRWIGIGLAPLFLIIALSGAVLALKPMQTPTTPSGIHTLPVQQLIDLLAAVDPLGEQVKAVAIDGASGLVDIRSSDPQIAGRYDPANGDRVATTAQTRSFDLFELAEHLHKELLIGADFLIQAASYLMLAIVMTAPFLAWPVLRNNLMGWHRGFGWVLLPLILMLPLTGVLMSLHVGMPELPRMSQPQTRLSLQQALTSAQQDEELNGLYMLRRFRGGSVMLGMHSGDGERLLVVTDHSVTPIHANDNLIKSLHEGTWAGPWSGTLNLLGATTLGLLTMTGSFSWLRRRRKRRQLRARRAAAGATA